MSRMLQRRRAGTAVAVTLALASTGLTVAATPAVAVPAPTSTVFINEIHYDSPGADTGEFVEVAGPVGTDLAGWSLALYNGNGGTVYDTRGLSGSIPASGVVAVDAVGLQNGAPDGVALVSPAGLVQFLSYEGSFAATAGPAAGQTSTDIAVSETGNEPAGQSLQLAGTGSAYGDFEWAPSATSTRGAANNGQVLQAPDGPASPVLTCPADLSTDTGAAASAALSASDADSGIASFAITSPAVAGISLSGGAPSAAGAPATASLDVAAVTAAGVYEVEITVSTDDAPAQIATCLVTVVVTDPTAVTPVNQVQGSGAASPLVGTRVTVEAVVTSLITSRDALNGFFVQERVADSDPATSEGVYVFCGTCSTVPAAGDLVRVTGTVAEFSDSTQIAANTADSAVAVLESGLPLPPAATITLPAAASTRDVATFEAVEGMRTTIATTLAVSEYFNLARFGELVLTAGERPYQFTQLNAPDVAGNAAYLADLATKRIVLDDASNDQNDPVTGATDEPYFFPTPGLSTGNRFRGGDTIDGLTGVLEYSFGAWKLRPVAGADYAFTSANPRPAAPDEVGGRLTVASFNVLNYFATIDTTASNDTGTCGPSGTADCRGADSEAERVRQLDKIVAALTAIDADVFGLIEIQNDAGAATQQIVEALNAATAPGTYDYVRTGVIGTDAIKQAVLYKPGSVTPAGGFQTLDSTDDPAFLDTRNRPSLLQTFDEVATGERFTVAVNHLKSKGSDCGGAPDDSVADGSGNCDGTRTAAAEALLRYLATDPTGSGDPDVLVIGDLNSYAKERPITALTGAGFTDLLDRFEGERSYGYLFDGQLGNLDHALANGSLNGQVTGAGGWNINADESPLLDYNDTVRDAGEAAFERESTSFPLYAADAYRSSDHDPAIVGLSLGEPVEQPLRLTLLHNNDGESSLLPAAPRGGIARFGTLVNELRAQADAEGGVLLLSSGDNFLAGPQLQASLEDYDGDTDYSDDGPFYDAVALDYLDYDASAVGNHEFDFGPGTLGYFLSEFDTSNIRFVSSNLDVTGDAALTQFVQESPGTTGGALVEWTRTTVDGRSVAIVGATTPRLASISSPGPDVEAREDVRLAVQDAVTAATADGTDIVVLIAHLQNIAEDQALVRTLSGVDAVIAGGGDELLANADDLLLPGAGTPFGAYPLVATSADGIEVPIVTTQGSYGYLGRLVLDIDADGEVVAVDDTSGPVRNVFDATTAPADQRTPDAFLLENVEQPVAAFTAALAQEVVAQSDVVLDARTPVNRREETNLGSLFADALRLTAEEGAPDFGATNPTVALQNSGGIRSDRTYGPGPISRLDAFQIAPFTNFVGYTIGLEPAKLKQILERSVSAATTTAADGTVSLQSEGRFGQISGIELVYDPTRTAQVVTRDAAGAVTITTPGDRVRQVTLTNNTPDPADDLVVVRNGVVVAGAPAVDLAANSFTVGQNGDNYPFNLTEGQFVNLPATYQQSLEDRLRELGTLTAQNAPVGGFGRIRVGGDVVVEPEPEPTPAPGKSGDAPGTGKGPGRPDAPGKSAGAPGLNRRTGLVP